MNELKKKTFQVIVFIERHFILQEIGSPRAENYKQNMEIAAFLKRKCPQLQNKTKKNDRLVSSAARSRHKDLFDFSCQYPVRPDKKNETDQINRKLFYGPPTNCSDPTIDYRLHLMVSTYGQNNYE